MEHSTTQCSVCHSAIKGDPHHGQELIVPCALCGDYTVWIDAIPLLRRDKPDFDLCAWIREQVESGPPPPNFTKHNVNLIRKNLRQYRVIEKQLKLLKAIEVRSAYAGQQVQLNFAIDFPLGYAHGSKEFKFLVESLVERRFISGPINNAIASITVSSSGWDYLDQMSRTPVLSRQAFVAMSFNSEFDTIYKDGIKRGIEDAGFDSYRVDDKPHPERIDMKIIAEIKNSRFVVADATRQRPNVYFEAGYAYGANIPVIWSVRADESEEVHFDIRQFNHIRWTSADTLRSQLADFIKAIIGRA